MSSKMKGSYIAITSSIVAASGGLLFGYDIGIIAGAILQLRIEFDMSCSTQEIIISCVLFGAIFASALGGAVIDLFGRKFTMIVNCSIFIIGSIILAFASSVPFLVAGRVLLGFAVGLSVVAECAYISEISSPEHRGKLVSLNEVAIASGFLLAYLTNFLLINMQNGWRAMFGISGILALIQCIALFFIPKSPRFMVIKNQNDEALKVLTRLRGCEDKAQEELSMLQHSCKVEKDFGWREVFSFKNAMAYRLLIGMGLVLFQQFSGLPSVLYYAPVLLQQVGFESDSSATLATIWAGVTKVIAVFLSILLVDKVGRKTLLITGCILMGVSMFTMASLNRDFNDYTPRDSCHTSETNSTPIELYLGNNTDLIYTPKHEHSTVTKTITLVALMVYTAAYSIGYGPVTWLICSEIFPSSVKGRAVALCGAVNWSVNVLVSYTFLDYMDTVGLAWTFITYGITCLLGIVFILLFVPETKGRKLEEINRTFSTMSLAQELNQRLSKVCCCCKCAKIERSSSYEPLSNNIALEPVGNSSSHLNSSTHQMTNAQNALQRDSHKGAIDSAEEIARRGLLTMNNVATAKKVQALLVKYELSREQKFSNSVTGGLQSN